MKFSDRTEMLMKRHCLCVFFKDEHNDFLYFSVLAVTCFYHVKTQGGPRFTTSWSYFVSRLRRYLP